MTALAPTLEAFFVERLASQRHASPNTISSYRDSFRLLLNFVQESTGIAPAKLQIEMLDAPLVGAFLEHLECHRGAAVATRNARLAAVHSLFSFAALRLPEHAGLIQRVLAIPAKRGDHPDIAYLTAPEVVALLAAPDTATRIGRRDRALLLVAVQTGMRVSELVGLRRQDVTLGTGTGAHVTCIGKGRKQRSTPLRAQTVTVVRDWLVECGDGPDAPLFPGPGGDSLSRDAVRRIINRHTTTATSACPSLAVKRVTPHVLRHTCAMQLLEAGVDCAVIALWLGHESIRTTAIYQHADLGMKERALARVTPPGIAPGRYHPPDSLLAFLEAL
jgi:site-specific recombinase XerD